MNKLSTKLVCIITLIAANLGGAAALEDPSKRLIPSSSTKFFPTILEERQERLAIRKKERADLQMGDKEFNASLTATIEQLKNQITIYEQALKANPDNEFIKQKLELTLERLQAYNDLKYARAHVISLIDEINKLDQEYLEDPELKKFAQSFLNKSTYSFDEDLLLIHEKMLERAKDVTLLTEQESNAHLELQNRKRASQALIEAYQNQKEKKEAEVGRLSESINFTQKQKAEIESLKALVFNDRKAADAMRILEAEYKYTLVQTKLFNAKRQLEALKGILRTIKPLTKITEANIAFTLDELDKKKQETRPVKENYRQEIEKLTTEQKEKEKELEALSKRYRIALDSELDEWSKEPKQTLNGCTTLAQVGTVYEEVQTIKRKKEFLEAQLAFEEEKLRFEFLRIDVKESFFKTTNALYTSEEKVNEQIKKYQIQKDENKANFALFKDRQNNVTALIATKKKALENLVLKQQMLEQQKNIIFKDATLEYEQCNALFKHISDKVQEQLDLLGKIAGYYSDIISKISQQEKLIEFITAELGSITPWGRPEHAISWDGIRNSIPDIQAFSKDVKDHIKTLELKTVLPKLKEFFTSGWHFFWFLIKLLLALFILYLIKLYLPIITNRLISVERAPVGIRWFSILIAVFLGFGIKHLVSIVIWVTAFILLFLNQCIDPYSYILFCLISIPYLLYLANRWLRYLVYFNEKYDYCFLSKEYQERFIIVFSTLVYATIIIVFFREAFIAGNYYKSELPTILLAINFIIFQIAAILLLSKDQILSLISTKNDFGKWIYGLVDAYYYLLQFFLIAIIVMSNPYVGYGRLVLFILKRLLYTAILLQLIMWIHEWFKRISSRIFFYFDSDEEVARDRFAYAKTWYGLLVVLIFAVFTFVGLLIAARIWHWPEALLKVQQWTDVVGWIKTPFLLEGTVSPISLFTIFKIIGFIFIGSLVSFAINRFVLGRIFDILLVDSGVQNTIASLIRYIIIITAIILGFTSVGLGELVRYLLWGLILGIGWVIKDPAADLIAYFILIVQRPIKVGDYIVLDEFTKGIVRRITPRSVELRRKNSTTIIIPNVQVTTRTVSNWNHARGFIAFDDILVTIAYKVDPEQVRELLMRVLNESRVVLKNPRPIVRLENFSDLGYVFLVRGFLSSNHTLDMWDIASDIRFAIVKRLHEHGIEIAYPVRIITSNSGIIEPKKEK